MDDIDYGALFGIDAEGAEVTEPAEPSGDTTAQGANEQEPAEPAAVEEQIEETNAERAEDGGQSTGGIARRARLTARSRRRSRTPSSPLPAGRRRPSGTLPSPRPGRTPRPRHSEPSTKRSEAAG